MMGKIVRYFRPKRKLYQVPKTISARYDRGSMTQQQAMIMMAGMARDPGQAQQMLDQLQAEHGRSWWQQIRLILLRPFDKTFRERLLILLRRAFGESDSAIPRYRQPRSQKPIADYRFPDEY